MDSGIERPLPTRSHPELMRLYLTVIAGLAFFLTPLAGHARQTASSAADPAPDTAAQKAKFDLVIEHQKKNDTAMDLFERIERVETKKNPSDPQADVKISRVIPAGTGTGHIPVNAEGLPADQAIYRAELEKLVNALSFAVADGHAQHDAYEKIAKKHKDRDELIDATRTAFIFTFIAREPRGDRMLSKYSMVPNPAYHPTSRSTSIFAKVRGFVWIDDESGQLARVEGQVTDDISVGLFLAKVNKGSHFMQEPYEFAPGLWFP